MFKAKKLTRNFAQGSLFRPLSHSRQFFVGALTTSGVFGVIAFGLMTKSALEVHVMPEKATDTGTTAEIKAPQAQVSGQTTVGAASTVISADDQQATTSQPIPAQPQPTAKSTPIEVQPQVQPTAKMEGKLAQTTTTTPKNNTITTVDFSTLGVRVVTGVNAPL